MKILEVLKIFLKNETFVKEKKLKIVAKWHSGEGSHVPSCRARLCIRPVLALYSKNKEEETRGL